MELQHDGEWVLTEWPGSPIEGRDQLSLSLSHQITARTCGVEFEAAVTFTGGISGTLSSACSFLSSFLLSRLPPSVDSADDVPPTVAAAAVTPIDTSAGGPSQ